MIYLNGAFIPKAHAAMSVEDRGTLFGDGVYEVIRYYAGRPLAMPDHLARLRRSLAGIRLAEPTDLPQLPQISEDLVRRNHMLDAKVYWQISRGAAPREHAIPQSIKPTVLVMTYPARPLDRLEPIATARATFTEDIRWSCCWIKSLMLLPNVLAQTAARDAGFDTAIFHRHGKVTEATAANLFLIRQNQLWTHPADQWILTGVTRQILLSLAVNLGITVHEQPFSTGELLAADEALICGTTTHVTAVTEIDNQKIGSGHPGPLTRQLHQALTQHVIQSCAL
jgi:D-alanine transaminase